MQYRGVIEGFFGDPWSWEDREGYAEFLKKIGMNFYMYAPKADSYLRKEWKKEFPSEHFENLKSLRSTYKDMGIKFGIGFSPFEIFHNFGEEAQSILLKKIEAINEIDPDVIGILFDDMDGNIPDLAKLQSKIVNFITTHASASRVSFCPTYYSFDPILDKVFGKRPDRYLEELGELLDESVDIMWTGPKVISSELESEHLKEVEKIIGRKPFIWDNYPVNDGPKNCKFIFLDAIKNRDPLITDFISGYMSNPMNQANLSKIPVTTVSDMLRNGDQYNPAKSFDDALSALVGDEFCDFVKSLVSPLKNDGLDNFSKEQKQDILKKIEAVNEPWAIELKDYIDGKYIVGSECLTQ
jgi:hypothetical protein